MSIVPQDPDSKLDPPDRANWHLRLSIHGKAYEVIVEPHDDGRRLTVRADASVASIVLTKGEVAELGAALLAPEPEEFCADCFAGMESSEHHEKCMVQRDDCDDYCLVPFGAHHPRCGVFG